MLKLHINERKLLSLFRILHLIFFLPYHPGRYKWLLLSCLKRLLVLLPEVFCSLLLRIQWNVLHFLRRGLLANELKAVLLLQITQRKINPILTRLRLLAMILERAVTGIYRMSIGRV